MIVKLLYAYGTDCGHSFCDLCLSFSTNLWPESRSETYFSFISIGDSCIREKTYVRRHICGQNFPQNYTLKIHIKTVHEGERNYLCVTCGKTFGSSTHLNGHAKSVHLGEKKQKCTVCSKRFVNPADLKFHVKTMHEGEKTYKCIHCGKCFSVNHLWFMWKWCI